MILISSDFIIDNINVDTVHINYFHFKVKKVNYYNLFCLKEKQKLRVS